MTHWDEDTCGTSALSVQVAPVGTRLASLLSLGKVPWTSIHSREAQDRFIPAGVRRVQPTGQRASCGVSRLLAAEGHGAQGLWLEHGPRQNSHEAASGGLTQGRTTGSA